MITFLSLAFVALLIFAGFALEIVAQRRVRKENYARETAYQAERVRCKSLGLPPPCPPNKLVRG